MRIGPLADIAAMAVLLLSYIWLWQDLFPGDFFVCLALYLGLGVASHRRHHERPAEIGIRIDNLGSALWLAAKVVAPLAVAVVLAGLALDTFRGLSPFPSFPAALRSLTWGTLQQYGLTCFFYRRLELLLTDTRRAGAAAACLFAVFHLPNPFLVPAALVTGRLACWIYRREPNVVALGIVHALLSHVITSSLPPEITFHMKIGPGLLRMWGS